MTEIHTIIKERYIHNTQGTFLRHLESTRTCQRFLILTPLYLSTVITFNGKPFSTVWPRKLRQHHPLSKGSSFFLNRVVYVLCLWLVWRVWDLPVDRVPHYKVSYPAVWRLDTSIQVARFYANAPSSASTYAITALVWAFRKFAYLPTHWTVEHDAMLAMGWWWLWTHTIRHDQGIFAATRYAWFRARYNM